jgi:zinc protease
MINPTFAEDELSNLKQQSVAALQAVSSDPETVGSVKLLQALYRASDPYYSKSITSAIREVKGLKRETLAEFHKNFWVAENTTIVVVGDIDAASVEQLFASHFGSWTRGKVQSVDVRPVTLPAKAKRIDVPLADKASVEISIGVPASLKRTDPDYLAAKIANNALGVDTISSRLGAVVREKHGLTYGVYSSFDDARFGYAPWTVKLSVNPDNVEKALKLVQEVLDGYLAEGISEQEFADEIGREYGSFVLRLASTSGIAEVIAALELCGVELNFIDKLNGELRALTREQVNAAMRKYFRADCAVTVVSGVRK